MLSEDGIVSIFCFLVASMHQYINASAALLIIQQLVPVKDLSLISYRIVDIGLYMLLPYQHSFSLVLSVLHQEFSLMLLVQLIG